MIGEGVVLAFVVGAALGSALTAAAFCLYDWWRTP